MSARASEACVCCNRVASCMRISRTAAVWGGRHNRIECANIGSNNQSNESADSELMPRTISIWFRPPLGLYKATTGTTEGSRLEQHHHSADIHQYEPDREKLGAQRRSSAAVVKKHYTMHSTACTGLRAVTIATTETSGTAAKI